MSPEPHRRFPAWAELERQGDRRWITDNLSILWSAASRSYAAVGRGVIAVDTTSQPLPGGGHPFAYLPQAELAPLHDADVERMVRSYDPAQEMVVVLLKAQLRMSTYRVQPVPRL